MRFGDIVRDPGLMDISLHGRRFTWSNARENPVLARLNIFIVSTEWNAKFTNTKQIALPNTSSDHCPPDRDHFSVLSLLQV